MPVSRLGAGHDSGETEYQISNFGYPVSCAHALAQTATDLRASLVAIINNSIVEFVELKFDTFYIEINRKSFIFLC